MAERYDPRVTPARPDLAAQHLEGKVVAARFVPGEVREVLDAQAPLRHAPSPDAPLDTEALKGERVCVYETTDDGWCWGQLASDHYVGWLPASALGQPGPPPTHKVSALRTLVFPGPSIKLPPTEALSFGAGLAVTHFTAEFAAIARGFVPARHLAPVNACEPDFVAVAERFLGVPYLWGGKTSLGIDCSGLVQIALAAAGIECPRDTDMQEAAVGSTIAAAAGYPDLQRGDLLFWTRHVAIACNAGTLVHANAYHMAVAIEPVADAMARICAAGNELRSVKRIAN